MYSIKLYETAICVFDVSYGIVHVFIIFGKSAIKVFKRQTNAVMLCHKANIYGANKTNKCMCKISYLLIDCCHATVTVDSHLLMVHQMPLVYRMWPIHGEVLVPAVLLPIHDRIGLRRKNHLDFVLLDRFAAVHQAQLMHQIDLLTLYAELNGRK